MSELPPYVWVVAIAALVVGILAGHYGWGRRWPVRPGKIHADYLAGLDFLITEQPDRALDAFLKLVDANPDTLETHFALGSLYRRRGEVERAIRVHRNLLARSGLAAEHREQALLALAQDYLRAGLLDRAETFFQRVGEGTRLRATALDALRRIYERQRDWPKALEAYGRLAEIKLAPPRSVAAHYMCELATYSIERGDHPEARRLLRQARGEARPFARAAVLRAQIAERDGEPELAVRLLTWALRESPKLLHDELGHLVRLAGVEVRDRLLGELVAQAETRDFNELKGLVFAALSISLAGAKPLRSAIEKVFEREPTLQALLQADGGTPFERLATEIGTLMERAETYRCGDCGFAARRFYWQCPGCQCWDTFETCVIVRLR